MSVALALQLPFVERLKNTFRNTWFHPRYIALREIRKFIASEGPRLTGRILDVGCGKKPYVQHLTNIRSYIGMDVPSTIHGHNIANVEASVLALPFGDATFDGILCTEVLEHTPDPNLALSELGRIARPGAMLLLTVPLSEQLHEEPNDYCRITCYWLRFMLAKNGWSIERLETRGGAWLELAYRFSSVLYAALGARIDDSGNLKPRLVAPLVLLCCALIQLAGNAADKLWSCPRSTIGYAVVAVRRVL